MGEVRFGGQGRHYGDRIEWEPSKVPRESEAAGILALRALPQEAAEANHFWDVLAAGQH